MDGPAKRRRDEDAARPSAKRARRPRPEEEDDEDAEEDSVGGGAPPAGAAEQLLADAAAVDSDDGGGADDDSYAEDDDGVAGSRAGRQARMNSERREKVLEGKLLRESGIDLGAGADAEEAEAAAQERAVEATMDSRMVEAFRRQPGERLESWDMKGARFDKRGYLREADGVDGDGDGDDDDDDDDDDGGEGADPWLAQLKEDGGGLARPRPRPAAPRDGGGGEGRSTLELYRTLVRHMRPGETFAAALQRLGAGSGAGRRRPLSYAERRRRKKLGAAAGAAPGAAAPTAREKAEAEAKKRATADMSRAATELVARGAEGVYEEPYELLGRRVARLTEAARREAERAQGWEYRWGGGAVQGPSPAEQMVEWHAAGYFKDAEVRRPGGEWRRVTPDTSFT